LATLTNEVLREGNVHIIFTIVSNNVYAKYLVQICVRQCKQIEKSNFKSGLATLSYCTNQHGSSAMNSYSQDLSNDT